MHEAWKYIELSDKELMNQCVVDLYRASGPGGQHRNKVSSAVRLRHQPTSLVSFAEESRSQHENRARAIRRLRKNFAMNVRGEIDPDLYKRSERLKGYFDKKGAIRINIKNDDYPFVVAEILDLLVSCELQVKTAAEILETSTAHLVSFLQNDTSLFDHFNNMRKAKEMKPLRYTK